MRLSDQDFFSQNLDTSIKELREVREEIEKNGDYQKARRLFANYIRATLEPDKYLSIPYSFEANAFVAPDEDERAAANRILDLKLISTGTPHQFITQVDWEYNPTANQYKEWTWQLNRHHEFRVLAHQYQLTKDEKYAKGFIRLLKSWIEQAIVPEQAKPYETKCWRTIEAGLRIYNWMYALHIFIQSPSLDDDTLVDFYKSIWEHGWRLRNDHFTHNWLIMEMNGLCQIGVLCPVFKQSKAWEQYALETLEKELTIQFYPDGFQYELATGYHQVVIINYIRALEVLKTYDHPIPEAILQALEKAADLYLKLVMPNEQIPNLNDGKWEDIGELLEPILPYCPHREDWKGYILRDKQQGKAKYQTELLPYSGFGVLRCEQGEDQYYGLLDAAPYGCAHQHEDKLNFIVNCYGKMLVTEGGNYAYDDSEMRKYVLSTRSHNTIRVDGKDQNRKAHYKWETDQINQLAEMTWACSEGIDWVEGVYHEGYGEELFSDIVHKRKVMLVKNIKGLEPFFIVIDRLTNLEAKWHQYEVLWHLGVEQIKQQGLGVMSLDKDEKNIMIEVAHQPHLKLQVIRGQEEPEFQGWLPIGKGLQGEYAPCYTLQYTLASEQSIRLVTVLCPTKQIVSPIKKVDAGQSLEDTEIIVTLISGETIKIQE